MLLTTGMRITVTEHTTEHTMSVKYSFQHPLTTSAFGSTIMCHTGIPGCCYAHDSVCAYAHFTLTSNDTVPCFREQGAKL
jgi:hypothetical protein